MRIPAPFIILLLAACSQTKFTTNCSGAGELSSVHFGYYQLLKRGGRDATVVVLTDDRANCRDTGASPHPRGRRFVVTLWNTNAGAQPLVTALSAQFTAGKRGAIEIKGGPPLLTGPQSATLTLEPFAPGATLRGALSLDFFDESDGQKAPVHIDGKIVAKQCTELRI